MQSDPESGNGNAGSHFGVPCCPFKQRLHTPGPDYYNPGLPSKQTFGQSRLSTAPPRTTFYSHASTAPAKIVWMKIPTLHTPGSYDMSLATSKPCSSLCSRFVRFQQFKV
ncbi:hypothetical protein P9112_001311 [Eukaryota sp. TZLM1-RC]